MILNKASIAILGIVGLFLCASTASAQDGVLAPIFNTKASLSTVCKKIKTLGSPILWKANASGHISSSDPRAKSTSLIGKKGKISCPSTSCIKVYASNGVLIHKLGRYHCNGTYAFRYYGGHGCGDHKSAATVKTLAKRNGGKAEVYVDMGGGDCRKVTNITGRQGSVK